MSVFCQRVLSRLLLQIGKWTITLRNPGPSTTVTRLHVTSKAPSDDSYPITTRAFLSHQRIDFNGMITRCNRSTSQLSGSSYYTRCLCICFVWWVVTIIQEPDQPLCLWIFPQHASSCAGVRGYGCATYRIEPTLTWIIEY